MDELLNRKLYNIQGDYMVLLNMLEDDEVDEECWLDTLEAVHGELQIKLSNMTAILDKADDTLSNIDNKIKKLTAYKKSLEGKQESLKNYIKYTMETTDNLKIDLGDRKISVVKNGGKLPMTITAEVPNSYLKIKYEPDNEKIRKDLENGVVLDFAELGERGTHLKY